MYVSVPNAGDISVANDGRLAGVFADGSDECVSGKRAGPMLICRNSAVPLPNRRL